MSAHLISRCGGPKPTMETLGLGCPEKSCRGVAYVTCRGAVKFTAVIFRCTDLFVALKKLGEGPRGPSEFSHTELVSHSNLLLVHPDSHSSLDFFC